MLFCCIIPPEIFHTFGSHGRHGYILLSKSGFYPPSRCVWHGWHPTTFAKNAVQLTKSKAMGGITTAGMKVYQATKGDAPRSSYIYGKIDFWGRPAQNVLFINWSESSTPRKHAAFAGPAYGKEGKGVSPKLSEARGRTRKEGGERTLAIAGTKPLKSAPAPSALTVLMAQSKNPLYMPSGAPWRRDLMTWGKEGAVRNDARV